MAAEKLDTRVRQEQIVQAALSIVGSAGVERLSIARVARRVNVVPSALYRHFRSKEEILDAVLGMVQDRLTENVRAARGSAPDAIGRLRDLLDRHLRLIVERPAIPRLVFSEGIYAGNKSRRMRMFKGIRRYLDAVADIVRDGQRAGELSADADPQAAALLFLGLVQPATVLSRLGGSAFNPTAEAEKTWPIFAAAIRRS